MNSFAQDLNLWIPRLLAIWRKRKGGAAEGPADGLGRGETAMLAEGVQSLSKGFTGSRQLVGEQYLSNPALLGAYLLYYWPISYAQARFALRFAPQPGGEALDLGCGPGPFSMAVRDAGYGPVLSLDHNKAALKLLEEVAASAGLEAGTRLWDGEKDEIPAGPFSLVAWGHALNEMWSASADRLALRQAAAEKALAALRPGGSMAVLEPALMNTTRDLLSLRDGLVKSGYPIHYPCLWRQDCPALKQDNSTCHSELFWDPPRMVRDLAYAAGTQKDAVKMAVVVFGKKAEAWPAPPEGRVFRVVSEPMLSKNGRTRILGCGPEGRLAISTTRQQGQREFFALQRGDLFKIEGVQTRENGYGLDAQSKLEVLSKSGPRKPRPNHSKHRRR